MNGGGVCPICTATDCAKMRPYQARHAIFAGLDLLHCADCGMVFADPMPSEDEWDAYNRDFFATSDTTPPEDDNAAPVLFFKGLARLRLAHIERILQGPLPETVLEIGPGPGFFYQAYAERLPSVKYCAVETDQSYHRPLRDMGAEVFSRFDEMDEGHRQFGLIVMSHVLEHCLQPRDFIRAALATLQPGGLLFIEIPCLDFEYKPVFDAHVLFFDKGSIGRLLANAGVCEYQLSYHGARIETLRRELSRPGRLVNRALAKVVRPYEVAESDRHLLDERTWDVVAPFMPQVENERPSRWLRALAKKGDRD